jgi:carbon monoxide dehydrogenase subunit G
MKLEQSFEVDAPLERVWEALVDIEHVAPCLPGAAVTGRNEDGTYNGTFTIKIGPTTASYTGKLEMQDVDEAGHSATMHAQGSDKRGQGGATATIVSKLSPADRGTRVEVVSDYHITGRLARFGRGGMIEDISERLLREFAGRLQSSLAGGGGAAAAPGEGASAGVVTGGAPAGEDEAPTAVHPVVPSPAEEPMAASGGASAGVEAEAEKAEDVRAEAEGLQAPPPPSEVAAVADASVPEPTGLPDPPGATESAGTGGPLEPTEPAAATEPPPPSEPAPAPEVEPVAASAPVPPAPEPAASPPPRPQAAPPPPPPPPPAAEPLEAGSLVGSVLVQRVKRNPKPLVAVAGGLILLRMLRRRR